MERGIEPANNLEAHMIRPTDIHEHLMTLYMLTIEMKLKTILELGTRNGESTIAFLEAARRIGGKVFSIDVNRCLKAKEKVKSYGLEKYWVFMQNDDLEVKWDKSIDHLFIDTSHLFRHTLKELRKYEPYVRKGGLITLHDTVTYPEVIPALGIFARRRRDLRIYKYFNNSGLVVIFKG
jgi:predicted O-methyltransferase YrrM